MKKTFLALAFITALIFPSGVLADSYSQGEVNYSISVDKKIRPISDNNSYDNISKEQKVFVNDDTVEYSIVVENTGKDILYDLVVTDYFPIVNQIILAPGEINKNNRQINWKIDKLNAGESKSFTVRAKIINSNNANSTLQSNVVSVKNNNAYDKDTASFYVIGKSMPKTGTNDVVVKSMVALSAIGFALIMRKIARGY